jgi:ferredoxin
MSERCQGERGPGAVGTAERPARNKVRPSRAARWRTAVLVLVHVLIAAHFLHWWLRGRSLTPFEPSEAIQFSTEGVVTVGFLLFALAIASTLVLGRWFCGWACHIVALQDLCRWFLLKLGIRPRLVDLGPLRAVPWLAFVYMFLAPIADRWMAGLPLGATRWHLVTDDLWRTFPKTWTAALATLGVCGFVIVWLLGSKGFCTYGCPYGGIFGVAEQLAPHRVRVTDACQGCGHCTAACSSNVNVAQEVREHGMVVDPGCMRCLDCVSVCPNDALYVGFGAPPILARTRAARRPRDWGRLALSAAFSFGALSVFLLYDGTWDLRFTAVLWAFSFAAMLVFRGKARPRGEHTLPEEALLAALFLVAMWGFRGLFGAVPFLFALGISPIVAWWGVQLVRLVRAPNVRLQHAFLKKAGRWTAGGVAFAAALVPIGWLCQQGWREQARVLSERAAERSARQQAHARALEAYDRAVAAANAARFEEAIAGFRAALLAEPEFLEARENLAGMLCQTGRFAEGLAEYEVALQRNPGDPETHALAARACLALRRPADAVRHLEAAVHLAPQHADLWAQLGDAREAAGDAAGAREARARARSAPER